MTKYFTNNYTITNLHKKPSIKSEIVTQMIYGDSFSISKRSKKWLKIKIKEDGYKGFIKNRKFPTFLKPTHKINVLKSNVFKNPNRGRKISEITFGSKIKVTEITKIIELILLEKCLDSKKSSTFSSARLLEIMAPSNDCSAPTLSGMSLVIFVLDLVRTFFNFVF